MYLQADSRIYAAGPLHEVEAFHAVSCMNGGNDMRSMCIDELAWGVRGSVLLLSMQEDAGGQTHTHIFAVLPRYT